MVPQNSLQDLNGKEKDMLENEMKEKIIKISMLHNLFRLTLANQSNEKLNFVSQKGKRNEILQNVDKKLIWLFQIKGIFFKCFKFSFDMAFLLQTLTFLQIIEKSTGTNSSVQIFYSITFIAWKSNQRKVGKSVPFFENIDELFLHQTPSCKIVSAVVWNESKQTGRYGSICMKQSNQKKSKENIGCKMKAEGWSIPDAHNEITLALLGMHYCILTTLRAWGNFLKL